MSFDPKVTVFDAGKDAAAVCMSTMMMLLPVRLMLVYIARGVVFYCVNSPNIHQGGR